MNGGTKYHESPILYRDIPLERCIPTLCRPTFFCLSLPSLPSRSPRKARHEKNRIFATEIIAKKKIKKKKKSEQTRKTPTNVSRIHHIISSHRNETPRELHVHITSREEGEKGSYFFVKCVTYSEQTKSEENPPQIHRKLLFFFSSFFEERDGMKNKTKQTLKFKRTNQQMRKKEK